MAGDTISEMERLLAIEGIKRAKATYWYALDTKQWDLLESTFTDDAIADYRGTRDLKPGQSLSELSPVEDALAAGDAIVIQGSAKIVSLIRKGVGKSITVHQGAAPIIDITHASSGTAIWPMFDIIDHSRQAHTAYGHYHETYRRDEGTWRIQLLRVTRLYTECRRSAHGTSGKLPRGTT